MYSTNPRNKYALDKSDRVDEQKGKQISKLLSNTWGLRSRNLAMNGTLIM